MHAPAAYRQCALAGATSLWETAEAELFTDPGNGGAAGFANIPDAALRRVIVQVTGGTVWVTCNRTDAASGYGFLMADGEKYDFGVPYHQLSFFIATSTPTVRLILRGPS